MSRYTTTLKVICESLNQTRSDLNNVDEIIDNAIPIIFQNFPIFDEAYRKSLCSKIIKHYYFREIAYETKAYWQFSINRKLNEIMPYYNKLYESTLITYDPLKTIDFTEIIKKTDNKSSDINSTRDFESYTSKAYLGGEDIRVGESEQNSENGTYSNSSTDKNKNTNKFSDTPQGNLRDVEDGRYLTDYRIVDDNGSKTEKGNNNTSANRSGTRTENRSFNKRADNIDKEDNEKSNINKNENNVGEYSRTISGKKDEKSYAKLIQEYRKALINIDMLIINELATEFLTLW